MEEPLKVDVWLVSSDIYQLQQKIDPFLALGVKYLLVKFTFSPKLLAELFASEGLRQVRPFKHLRCAWYLT